MDTPPPMIHLCLFCVYSAIQTEHSDFTCFSGMRKNTAKLIKKHLTNKQTRDIHA